MNMPKDIDWVSGKAIKTNPVRETQHLPYDWQEDDSYSVKIQICMVVRAISMMPESKEGIMAWLWFFAFFIFNKQACCR